MENDPKQLQRKLTKSESSQSVNLFIFIFRRSFVAALRNSEFLVQTQTITVWLHIADRCSSDIWNRHQQQMRVSKKKISVHIDTSFSFGRSFVDCSLACGLCLQFETRSKKEKKNKKKKTSGKSVSLVRTHFKSYVMARMFSQSNSQTANTDTLSNRENIWLRRSQVRTN